MSREVARLDPQQTHTLEQPSSEPGCYGSLRQTRLRGEDSEAQVLTPEEARGLQGLCL